MSSDQLLDQLSIMFRPATRPAEYYREFRPAEYYRQFRPARPAEYYRVQTS